MIYLVWQLKHWPHVHHLRMSLSDTGKWMWCIECAVCNRRQKKHNNYEVRHYNATISISRMYDLHRTHLHDIFLKVGSSHPVTSLQLWSYGHYMLYMMQKHHVSCIMYHVAYIIGALRKGNGSLVNNTKTWYHNPCSFVIDASIVIILRLHSFVSWFVAIETDTN